MSGFFIKLDNKASRTKDGIRERRVFKKELPYSATAAQFSELVLEGIEVLYGDNKEYRDTVLGCLAERANKARK